MVIPKFTYYFNTSTTYGNVDKRSGTNAICFEEWLLRN